MDTGCSLKDLAEAMDDKNEWWERELGKSMLVAPYDNDDNDSWFKFSFLSPKLFVPMLKSPVCSPIYLLEERDSCLSQGY